MVRSLSAPEAARPRRGRGRRAPLSWPRDGEGASGASPSFRRRRRAGDGESGARRRGLSFRFSRAMTTGRTRRAFILCSGGGVVPGRAQPARSPPPVLRQGGRGRRSPSAPAAALIAPLLLDAEQHKQSFRGTPPDESQGCNFEWGNNTSHKGQLRLGA